MRLSLLALSVALFLPQAALAKPLEPVTLPNSQPKNLVEKGKAVHVGPLPLLETPEERAKSADLLRELEAKQLNELWTATLDRSPDIQFAISILQPQSDPKHKKSKAVQMLGGLLYGAGQAAPLAFPNSGIMRFGTGVGSGMLDSVIRGHAKEPKNAASEANMVAVYSVIRHTADRVVDAYRGYKNSLDLLVLANEAVKDNQKMMQVVSDDRVDALRLHLDLNKAQREVRKVEIEAYTYRAQLIDLCGAEAVAKLNGQIMEQREMLVRTTGSPTWRPELECEDPAYAQRNK